MSSKMRFYLILFSFVVLFPVVVFGTRYNNHTEIINLSFSDSIRYLAIGDSYTVGEGASLRESFPYLLVEYLNRSGIIIKEHRVIAKTGWTTDELIDAIKEEALEPEWQLITVLIGVNNQYRGRSISNFKEELEQLLEMALVLAHDKKDRVLVLSIPDYGPTPFGQKKNPSGTISQEIDSFNSEKEAICKELGVPFIYITDISREVDTDASLLAKDGLHPSGRMYYRWVERIFPFCSLIGK